MTNIMVTSFTPSLLAHEDLEKLFVQRHDEVQRAVELAVESLVKDACHNMIFYGPRGIGKTHLISLIYYRVKKAINGEEKARIAWLNEEEWGVATYLDFLLCVVRALVEEYKDKSLNARLEEVFELSIDDAELYLEGLLANYLEGGRLLIIVENINEIFSSLGSEGQHKLRAFLQNLEVISIIASSTILIKDTSDKNKPFYGFFLNRHLEPLTDDQALQFLVKIARLSSNEKLERYIESALGRARVEAINNISGGNHRVMVIFSQFLAKSSLEELVTPFLKTLNELMPYYQSKMKDLAAQQRKIVEYLCEARHAVQVKEIAGRLFIKQQSLSRQLLELSKKGYVKSERIGRESYYEISEPLLRFCIDAKRKRGKPLKLFIDFLVIWYSAKELQERLDILPDNGLERAYITEALDLINSSREDELISNMMTGLRECTDKGEYRRAKSFLAELSKYVEDYEILFLKSYLLYSQQKYEQALKEIEEAIRLKEEVNYLYMQRGRIQQRMDDYLAAIDSFQKVLAADGESATVHNSLSKNYYNTGALDEAQFHIERAIELDDNKAELQFAHSLITFQKGECSTAKQSALRAIQLDPDVSLGWMMLALSSVGLKDYETAESAVAKAYEMAPDEENIISLYLLVAVVNKNYDVIQQVGNAFERFPALNSGVQLLLKGIYDDEIDIDMLGFSLKHIVLSSYLNERMAAYVSLGKDEDTIGATKLFMCEPLIYHNNFQAALGCLENIQFGNYNPPRVYEAARGVVVALMCNTSQNSARDLKQVLKVYEGKESVDALVYGVMKSIPAFLDFPYRDTLSKVWVDNLERALGDNDAFAIVLSMYKVAYEGLVMGDETAVLSLPMEERRLFEELVEGCS